jgi:NDP-sugar pyrophosphorylase family protein
MVAVLLAAGRGSRMGALTADTPKPLLPLCGRPIIEHILLGIQAAGVRRAVVVTGYRREQVEARLGDGSRLGLHITYRHQPQPEGTARAIALVRGDIGGEPFLLSWGDVIVEPSQYAALLAEFRAAPCDVLLSVNDCEDPFRGAAVYVDATGRVVRLIEKPPRGTSQTRWNNAGIFVFTPAIFTYVDELQLSARREYELPQAIASMVADQRHIRAYPIRGFWSDLGTPADLAAAERAWHTSAAS